MHSLVFLLSLCVLCQSADHSHDWNYGENGPNVWSEMYPACGGERQSPINILTACTVYQNMTPFVFGSGYNEGHNFTLKNNGHTIVGTYNMEAPLSAFRISGGDLNGTFELVNFHLHWGENHKSGSEHEINGASYAGEIHFVYTNALLNQLAVLAVFMHSTYPDNQTDNATYTLSEQNIENEWQKFFNRAQTLVTEDNTTTLNLNLALLMGQNFNDFWRYQGSLTTPPCTENVIWTIFKHPIVFSENEFQIFRQNIYFEDYRRPQPLYTRKVYRNFHNETSSPIPDYNCCVDQSPAAVTTSGAKHLNSSIVLIFVWMLIRERSVFS